MKNFKHKLIMLATSLTVLASCSPDNSLVSVAHNVDLLIINGTVYTGDNLTPQSLDIAICEQVICGLHQTGEHNVDAKKIIDAKGKVVSPGFIDPHTHSLAELRSSDKNHNLNYLTQGVTTVVNGNDGEGPVDIAATANLLEENGIGTNVALFVGHGSVREQVMGREQRFATEAELTEMSALVEQAMIDGALGLSSGLYYVPGSYANTAEVIALAKIASKHNGIYDTHMRDESTFNIGFLSSLDEAIEVAEQANIHLHLAHIKALGVDVWGQSQQAIEKIELAQKNGISISADQYPWLASGTKLHSAVMPKWVMADSKEAFYQRLNDPKLSEKLNQEIKENIRRRGGPTSLLVTAFKEQNLVGLNLKQIAEQRNLTAVATAMQLVQEGDVRVASFNMSPTDVEAFMLKPWVVTSSDGTNGHPRKFASFPQKYSEYVRNKKLLTIGEFISRSSSQTAKILGLQQRGSLKLDFKADVIIFDADEFAPQASFAKWNEYSKGVDAVIINGNVVIENEQYLNKLAGKFIFE
ncbi:amidohydrolase family protein [Thalassotalea psychrophila]|uniref:Amidohydrolase family protein n=1 Tax=Thalassotalea psychrophila TaxID=3065647 RepID=A0ABY9TP93_9GAMM|nr:amidohydrolase family protein [Colwelliaceae bacterium SQ149]